MKNPFPTQPGFAARVAYAKRALRRFGENYAAAPYSRRFDDCFEMFDGDAVVFALMHATIAGDTLLERGIRNMGAAVWPQWSAIHLAGQGMASADLFSVQAYAGVRSSPP